MRELTPWCEYCQDEIHPLHVITGCIRNSCILKRLVEAEKLICTLMDRIEKLEETK